MRVRDRDRRQPGRAAGVDAHEALVPRPDRIDAEPLGVADAEQRVGRERIDHGLYVVELAPRILQRQRHRFAHQLRIVGVFAPRLEFGLSDADDSHPLICHERSSELPITTTVWYCIAKPLAACASARRTPFRW